MIKKITEKFGSFDRNSLKERFKDDPEGHNGNDVLFESVVNELNK